MLYVYDAWLSGLLLPMEASFPEGTFASPSWIAHPHGPQLWTPRMNAQMSGWMALTALAAPFCVASSWRLNTSCVTLQVQAAEDDTLRGTIDEGGDSPMESAAR